MKKWNSWVGVLAAGFLAVSAQVAQAGTVADGAYVGIQGGYGAAIVDAQMSDNDGAGGAGNGTQDWSFSEGGIGLDGGSYGAFMGYGFRMSSLYVGMDVAANWSDMEFDPGAFTVRTGNTDADSGNDAVSQASAKLAFNGTVSGRLGYYMNPSTLFSLSGGLSGGMFEVSWDNQKEEYWDPGITYGVAMESALFDGVALRFSWNITDYYDAEVFGIGEVTEKPGNVSVEIQPTMSVAHLGLMYTF